MGAVLEAGFGGRGGGVRGAGEGAGGGSLHSRTRCVSRKLSKKSASKDNYYNVCKYIFNVNITISQFVVLESQKCPVY